MSAMDDAFGPQSKRPDHPDFWHLSEVVLKLDGRMEAAAPEDRQQVFEDAVSERVDLESISYMAYQRAIRMVPPTIQNMEVITMIASAYIDGFTTGCDYQHGADS